MGSGECVGAVRPASLGARHAVVQPLKQPRLEAARIGRLGETLQHRRGGGRAHHGRPFGVDMSSEEGDRAEIVRRA